VVGSAVEQLLPPNQTPPRPSGASALMRLPEVRSAKVRVCGTGAGKAVLDASARRKVAIDANTRGLGVMATPSQASSWTSAVFMSRLLGTGVAQGRRGMSQS